MPSFPGRTNWTDDEDQTLRVRWNAKVNVRAIAAEIGDRSVAAVRRRAIRLELPKRRWLRKKHPGKQRDDVVTVHLDRDQHDYLSKRAFEKHMTMAVYVRILIDRDRGR